MISSATSRIGPSTTLRAKTVAISATPIATIRPSAATPTPLMSSAPIPRPISAGGGPWR